MATYQKPLVYEVDLERACAGGGAPPKPYELPIWILPWNLLPNPMSYPHESGKMSSAMHAFFQRSKDILVDITNTIGSHKRFIATDRIFGERGGSTPGHPDAPRGVRQGCANRFPEWP